MTPDATTTTQSLIDFLGSLGLSIGADANAATSYDDTQYTLRVPTDVPGALDRALLVLEDWAQGAAFDQDGIERERGIVLSEWRMNLGAGERTAEEGGEASPPVYLRRYTAAPKVVRSVIVGRHREVFVRS